MGDFKPTLPPFEEARHRLREAMDKRRRMAEREASRRSIGPAEEARRLDEEIDVATVPSVALADLMALFAHLDAPPRFEPTDAQVAWAMNVAGPLELQEGATLERVLGTERYAVLVRTIISAAQSQTADDLDAYAEGSPLLKRIADTRGRELWGAEPRPAQDYARQSPRS